MSMSKMNPHMNWLLGYSARRTGRLPSTHIVEYRLSELMARGFVAPSEGLAFLEKIGLSDFFWEMSFPEDFELPDDYLVDRIADAAGYVIFVHGWTGNHLIWEDLPAMVVLSNRQLVSFAIDHNGFGESVFSDVTPGLDACNPPAAMQALHAWIDMMNLRRQPGSPRPKVINLVGHSMGGATLFYSNPMAWRYGELTRFALAPALLLEDEGYRLFYTTLGLGIGILQRLPALEIIERFVKPTMLSTLVTGASSDVKMLHSQQYTATPRGITGATFMAMGRLNNYEIARDFRLMRVMLGHRDPLVGLTGMMDLLMKLEFPAANVHVVPGTHYMFSVGNETPMNAYQHAQNRELVVDDILELHDIAYKMQKQGERVGGGQALGRHQHGRIE